jgi:hypothetical protein
MIIVAKSSNFKQTFPNNCNNDFRISLFKNETFSKTAKLAIREIIVPPIESDTLAYIICSAVIYSQLEEEWRRVIRLLLVQASEKHQYIKFNPPLCILICLVLIWILLEFHLKTRSTTLSSLKKRKRTRL